MTYGIIQYCDFVSIEVSWYPHLGCNYLCFANKLLGF